jgi:hypothetical protein
MSRRGKILLAALLVVGLFWIGVGAAFAWAVHAVATSPTISVEVREHGGSPGRVSLRFPSALLVGASFLAPDDARRALHAEIGGQVELDRWAPALGELARQLETIPDATLVEVRDGSDHVTVVKHGDDLRIRVRSTDADVDVTLPAGLAGDLLAGLAVVD